MWLDYDPQTSAPRPPMLIVPQDDLENGLAALPLLFRLVAGCAAAHDGYLPLVFALDGGTLPASLTQEIALVVSEYNGHMSKFGRYASQHVGQSESPSRAHGRNGLLHPTLRAASTLALKVAERRGDITRHDLVAAAGDSVSDTLLREILDHTVEIWHACAQRISQPVPAIESDIIVSKMATASSTPPRLAPVASRGFEAAAPPRVAYQAAIAAHAPAIYIIAKHPAMQRRVVSATLGLGYTVEAFPSVAAFTAATHSAGPCCVLVEMSLLGATGSLLLGLAQSKAIGLPLIFTNHMPTTRPTAASGRPGFCPVALREAIRQALCADFNRLDTQARQQDIRERYHSLTQRERQVLSCVLLGLLNKQIAARLLISEITVKLHRRHVMQKLGARNPVDLAMKASQLVDA